MDKEVAFCLLWMEYQIGLQQLSRFSEANKQGDTKDSPH